MKLFISKHSYLKGIEGDSKNEYKSAGAPHPTLSTATFQVR
jgi:hypothetical protein